MSFGYPLSETQSLGFSIGVNKTDITTGEFAVQEIIGSPRVDPRITEYFTSLPTSTAIGMTGLLNTLPDSAFETPMDGFLDIHGDDFLMFPLTVSWRQSRLNRGLLPTRGTSQSLSLEFTVPGSDLEYYKLQYTGQIFVPLSRLFTLRFRTELGYGGGFGDTDGLPFFENYYSGGFGSVRGFKNNTLGPRSTAAIRYLRNEINQTASRPVHETIDDLIRSSAYQLVEDPIIRASFWTN